MVVNVGGSVRNKSPFHNTRLFECNLSNLPTFQWTDCIAPESVTSSNHVERSRVKVTEAKIGYESPPIFQLIGLSTCGNQETK